MSSGAAPVLMLVVLSLLGTVEQVIDAPGEVPLEGAAGLGAGASRGEPSLPEGLRLRVDAELSDRDPVQGGVEWPVPATIQPMPLPLA